MLLALLGELTAVEGRRLCPTGFMRGQGNVEAALCSQVPWLFS